MVLCNFVKIFVYFVVKNLTTKFTKDTKIFTRKTYSNIIFCLFSDRYFLDSLFLKMYNSLLFGKIFFIQIPFLISTFIINKLAVLK